MFVNEIQNNQLKALSFEEAIVHHLPRPFFLTLTGLAQVDLGGYVGIFCPASAAFSLQLKWEPTKSFRS